MRQSQLSVETRTPTPYGEARSYLSMDWAASTNYAPGGTDPAAISDNIVPRMKYAYGTLGGWLAGQADSNFEDPDANAEVIDLRSLQPFDIDTVIESVKKTHHAVVVQEQWLPFGTAAEFAAQIQEKAFDYLDAPVERVAGAFTPMPYARVLELAATPHEAEIISAVKKTLERNA